MKKAWFLTIALWGLPLLSAIPPQKSLELLVEGNQRFAQDRSAHPNRSRERREKIAETQEPFAVILGCSDSRVSSEIIFDQGLGDLFVVRVAGNVFGPLELSSMEYGVFHLHSSLILVLGHENCGAVQAVLQEKTSDIQPIAKLIAPAVKKTKKQPGNPLENAIRENVRLIVGQLKKHRSFKEPIEKGRLQVVGGYYHLESGQVELLPLSN